MNVLSFRFGLIARRNENRHNNVNDSQNNNECRKQALQAPPLLPFSIGFLYEFGLLFLNPLFRILENMIVTVRNDIFRKNHMRFNKSI